MDHPFPFLTPAGRPGHPLAEVRRPVPVAIVILVGVLAALGWSAEQLVTLLAVLLPVGAAALGSAS